MSASVVMAWKWHLLQEATSGYGHGTERASAQLTTAAEEREPVMSPTGSSFFSSGMMDKRQMSGPPKRPKPRTTVANQEFRESQVTKDGAKHDLSRSWRKRSAIRLERQSLEL